jgi:8-oxo-dGTP pyrophosphatase MutT (NUDIX family)
MDTTPCTYRVSVKAIVKDNEGRILLLREKDGSWEFPGGGLEHGENPRTALTREVSEETGLNVDWMSDQPIAFWTIRKEVGSPTLKWFAFTAFEAKVSGAFRPDPNSDEAQEAKYFSSDEAKSLKLHDNTKPFFTDPSHA